MRSQDWTYKELEYNLADSQSARAFMHMVYGITFSSSALKECIKGITAETWEAINRIIVVQAKVDGFEKGRVTRTDSTVSECNIHYPTESTLIVDCLRVISRICFRMKEFGSDVSIAFTHKKGRKIALQILSAKNAEARLPLYKALIDGAGDVFLQLPEMRNKFAGLNISKGSALKIQKELRHIQDCMEAILAQTIARVVDGKHLEAKDKVVSVFESHTDVISKGQRETQFGHKINLTSGRSNLVIDCTIEDGNPNDGEKFLEMLDRQKDIYGVVPRQTTCDGGYASKANVAAAKERGVKDVCFSKRCNLEKEDMCKSKGVFNKKLLKQHRNTASKKNFMSVLQVPG